MDYQLTEDQAALVSAVEAIVRDHAEMPQAERLSYSYFDWSLQTKLTEAGFLDAARDLGPLEAALVVVEGARIPAVVEAGVSALVVPQLLPAERLEGPVAVVAGDRLAKAHRNLSVARTALIEDGDDVVVHAVADGEVAAEPTVYAYPYGRFLRPPQLKGARRLAGAAATLAHWSRVALAAEFAGAADSAVQFTVEYVKQRQVFGHPIGAFQAVQHRLAQCHQVAMAVRYLALNAAWSGQGRDADAAACYAQQHVQKLIVDLHQFNGAMGVTNEHLLHFWTYRLRALQSEAGGVYAAAQSLSNRLWGAGRPSFGDGPPTPMIARTP